MGNKDSKNIDIDQFMQATGGVNIGGDHSMRGNSKSSKEALADCLASLSDMANTGVDSSTQNEIPGKGSVADRSLTPGTVRRVSIKLRQKLQAKSTSKVSREVPPSNTEDMDGMLQKLSVQDGNDNNAEWENMRSWMVWCMRNNLSGIEDDSDGLPVVSRNSRGRRLSRQSAISFDNGPRNSNRRLSYQTAFDVDRDGKMSAQSSLESHAET